MKRREVMIGSTRNATIRIDGTGVAGVACMLQYNGVQWIAIDLGSQPDVKIGGKSFVEKPVTEACQLQVGEHTFELIPPSTRRVLFTNVETKGSAQMTVYKWRGAVLEASLGQAELDYLAQSGTLEVAKIAVNAGPKLGRGPVAIDGELKRPLMGTLGAFLVFFLILLGIPMPKVEEKPKDNVYTKMIFDGKILAKRKAALKNTMANPQGNGQVSEGTKAQASQATKAVNAIRKSGIQSVVSKIAARAAVSAKLIAQMAATPQADAAIEQTNFGTLAANSPSAAAAAGKTGTGNNKGFKVSGIGTGGKGGGTGDYKDGAGLGTGAIGSGDVGLDDEESVIEGGLDREVIAAVIKEHLGQIRYCYERQLSANPDLYGKVKVRFNIDADGKVEAQSIGQSTLKNAMVEECILRRIASWKFPKPKGGTKVLVSYPFLFKSVN